MLAAMSCLRWARMSSRSIWMSLSEIGRTSTDGAGLLSAGAAVSLPWSWATTSVRSSPRAVAINAATRSLRASLDMVTPRHTRRLHTFADCAIRRYRFGSRWCRAFQKCQALYDNLETYLLACRGRRQEAAEEAITLPLWGLRGIGDLQGQGLHHILVLAGGSKINRLIDVIRRRMIALGEPLLMDRGLRRALDEADGHRKRGDPLPDEAVLVAAHEGIAQRFGIRLYLHAQLRCDFARIVAQVGFGQSLHGQNLQRDNWQKHVGIEVGNDGGLGHRGMRGEVLRSQQAFLFGRDKQKQQRAFGPGL